MPEFWGTIVLAQESRFQVIDAQGAAHLFLLSPHAAAEPAQLAPLASRQARVRVNYVDGDEATARVAHAIVVEETP